MKYERLTYEEDNKIKYHGYSNLIINRLFELEDKIESGELISTKEVGDTEIEFFCKHNDTVRKETAQTILIYVAKAINAISWSNADYANSINLMSMVEDIAHTYGVELFGISEQVEDKGDADEK